MTQTYTLSGLTCTGCAAKVKGALLAVPEIETVDISLDPQQAVVGLVRPVSLADLQQVVAKAGKYTIGETKKIESQKESWFKTYKPLLLIFGFITGVSLIVATRNGFSELVFMNSFMAGFFLVFSFFKLLDVRGFASTYRMYDLLAMRVPAYGFVYPFLELILGLAYLTGFNSYLTNIATVALMGFSSLGVIRSVVDKKQIQCACLGAVFNLPMSTVTIVEDLVMVAMAGWALLL